MLNDLSHQMDLTDYVKEQLKKGYDAFTIRNFLVNQGYNSQDVDDAFDHIGHKPVNKALLFGVAIVVVLGIFGYVAFSVMNLNLGGNEPARKIITPSDEPSSSSQASAASAQNTCYDGLQNCHSGKCELGVDCSGPCSQCSFERNKEVEKEEQKEKVKVSFATCDDGILNGLEAGVDCGGSCQACLIASTSLTNLEMLERAKNLARTDSVKAAKSCSELVEGIRDNCLDLIAKESGQHNYCREIGSDSARDSCYIDFAVSGNTDVCGSIADNDLRDSCFSLRNLESRNV